MSDMGQKTTGGYQEQNWMNLKPWTNGWRNTPELERMEIF